MESLLGVAQPNLYNRQFNDKVIEIDAAFKAFNPPKLEPFASHPSHFRMRAEFKVWHEANVAHYAMYKPGEYKKPVRIQEYSIGSERMCHLMPPLMAAINQNETLKRKLFQIEFLTTTTNDALVTLIYHRELDTKWEDAARSLQALCNCKIIGRSRKQKVTLEVDFVIETMHVNGKTFKYQQVETGFTQPNAGVCQSMLNWAVAVSKNIGGDLLELYCGNGNFTLPLAMNFNKVLATEVSKTSVHSARYNISLNHIENVDIVRMSSEEFTQAMEGVREFRRLKEIALDDYTFSTVFVDPPRAGLDDATTKMISRFDNILYISCNPETLKHNLDTLSQSHKVERFAFFDQFPYTHHCECGVLLARK
ncbi:MAG: tRNA (uridine(54)-C5)-methyltransferase TrmA [Agarilytica sp.]